MDTLAMSWKLLSCLTYILCALCGSLAFDYFLRENTRLQRKTLSLRDTAVRLAASATYRQYTAWLGMAVVLAGSLGWLSGSIAWAVTRTPSAVPATKVAAIEPSQPKIDTQVIPKSKVNLCAASANEIARFVDQISRREGLPQGLLRKIVKRESGYRPCAVSAKGALGLMQLMPSTLHELKVKNPFDPEQNLNAGVALLKRLRLQYGDEWKLVLSAYNAGPGAVALHGGIPPYPETLRYVSDILDDFEE
jgi:soluble lytic murein transglycosylase-like protein